MKKTETITKQQPATKLIDNLNEFNFQSTPASLKETQFEQLIARLPAAIYTTDQDGYITLYNDAAVEIWGRKPDIGKDMWCGSIKIFEPDGITEVPLEKCPMAIALKEKRKVLVTEPYIIERPDGIRKFFIPHPEPNFDAEGNLIGATNLLMDVTESKMAEEQRAMLAAIIKSSGDAIISKNLEGIITSWNDAAERMYGYTASEMIGQSILKLFPADKLDEETYILNQVKEGKTIKHYETVRLKKDGSPVEVSVTISAIKDHRGTIIGASKIARDITQQKLAEKMIREKEEHLRMAVESAKLGTWEYDPSSFRLICSEESRKICGIPEELHPDFQLIAEHIHAEDKDLFYRKIKSSIDPAGNGKFDMQLRIRRFNDKETRWIRAQGIVFFTSNKQPERLIGTMLDITEEKIREQELLTDITDMKALEQRKDDFIKMASHELKTPITSINGYVQLLLNIYNEQNKPGDEKSKAVVRTSLQTIAKQVAKLTRLISELLDLSKIESGRLELYKTEFDLEELVEETIQEARQTTSRHAIIFRSDYDGKITADRDRIAQVMTNLLSNAIKYSPDADKVEVLLSGNDKFAMIRVIDHGIGIDKKDQQKIFDRFYRVEGKDELTFPGFGIGLFITSEIIQRHQGRITVQSEKNKGSLFTITLPIHNKDINN